MEAGVEGAEALGVSGRVREEESGSQRASSSVACESNGTEGGTAVEAVPVAEGACAFPLLLSRGSGEVLSVSCTLTGGAASVAVSPPGPEGMAPFDASDLRAAGSSEMASPSPPPPTAVLAGESVSSSNRRASRS